MDNDLIKAALESMMEATKDDATPIIRRLARIQARHALEALATVAAANDEAFARGVEAAALLALEHAAPEGCERFDYDEACHDIAAAIRLLSQGGGK